MSSALSNQQPQNASMLKALVVSEPGSPLLTYPNLSSEARVAHEAANPLLDMFWEAEAGSIEETDLARKAAIGYLVLTAAQLQGVPPSHQEKISSHFTRSSIEIYGEPEEDTALSLISDQIAQFSSLADNAAVEQNLLNKVLGVLSQANPTPEANNTLADKETMITTEVREVLESKFGDSLKLFDDIDQDRPKIEPEYIQQQYQECLKVLAQDEPAWRQWSVEIVPDSGMSAKTKSRQIHIGDRGNYLPERLKPLFAHEVLVHGLRSVNGEKTGNHLLQYGLPGNVDIEEGIGILFEYALSGNLPNRIIDRYIDTALALGINGSKPLSRQELHELHTDRLMVRAQANGEHPDRAKISQSAWGHVDRIYRGSLGNDIVGVNTKDIAYYQGYHKIVKYIQQELAVGKKIEEVFDYIMSGCFDPTSPEHESYVVKQQKSGSKH